ncbi:lipopolysaccharide biosynthesis protein [Anaerobium acetethylicum]|uniref:Membrane protein involved in the export of O-antigen and teichoic acid n=1 Tax=Anaerobium acetethylicum TaxID=1619234 RepID=A0A1D3TR98_9FIRM|nr:hypothetical protein [Anaerobium acetethylicum]SCP96222.1 Membrane protein involved in the export of O-antigen and teichoic acid [Anaerobium acetethylicum]
MSKDNRIIKNVATGFGGQCITLILGLIVPRIFITSYGSDANGFLSTLTQIFTYMALLEAGIGQAARNALFKPFGDENKDEISEITYLANCYFRKFTICYAIGVTILSFALPFVLKTNIDRFTIFLLVMLEGMSGVVSFYFIQTPSIILSVDGKGYVNNAISLTDKIIGYATKIIMASLGISIVILQVVHFFVTITKVFAYEIYFKKHYGWIAPKRKVNSLKLKDRNSYILTEVCWTIFSSTDMIVLSIFVSTQLSSVYGIYNMIFANISSLLSAVFISIGYLIGYSYHNGTETYKKLHDSLNSIFIGLVTILMSVCYVLTIPFVSLYTRGITDVNYIYSSLPLMFCLIQILSWSRYVGGQLTGIAGYAMQTGYISLVEALTNLILSVLFVHRFGIVGVTLATVIALPLKVVWCTYIADKKVMQRSYWRSISIIGVNLLFFFSVVLLSKFYTPKITSYGQCAVWGIILTVVFSTIGMGLNFLVNRDCWQVVRRYILKR